VPQKGKKQPAPHARVVVPVFVLQFIGRSPVAAGVGEERRIGAREYLLPAHAVRDHEDHVLRLAGPGGRCARQAGESDEEQLRESGHGWLRLMALRYGRIWTMAGEPCVESGLIHTAT